VPREHFGTLLKVRGYQEKKAQQELSNIRGLKNDAEDKLARLDDARDAEISDAGCVSKTNALEMQTSRAFLKRLSKEIRSQKIKIDDIEKQETQKTHEVVKRKQAKEMIQTLEDKYRISAVKEQDGKDQRLMDVLAQRAHTEKIA
jgi:flagellar export protein FliJ